MKSFHLRLFVASFFSFLLVSFSLFASRGVGGGGMPSNEGGSQNSYNRGVPSHDFNRQTSGNDMISAQGTNGTYINSRGVHLQSWSSSVPHYYFGHYTRYHTLRNSNWYPGGPIYNPYYAFPNDFYYGDFPYYYGYSGFYYDFIPYNYVIVTSPEDIDIPSLEPTPVYQETDTSAEISTAPANSNNTITINIPNSKGGFTPVVLTKFKDGYKGPQGEYYEGHPTVEALKALYGN
jgi:hypothetical protein